MVIATAAVLAGVRNAKKSSNYCKARAEARRQNDKFWDDVNKMASLQKVINKYDKSKTGKLSQEELGNLLQDLAKGERPTDEEVTWVLKTADASNKIIDGQIDRRELQTALDVWHNYEKQKPMIDSTFAKYDVSGSNKLEFAELKKLLQDLNDGKEPEDDEVRMVMELADGTVNEPTGGINRTELVGAISMWS